VSAFPDAARFRGPRVLVNAETTASIAWTNERARGYTFANFAPSAADGGDDVPRSRSRQNFPRARVELLSDPLQGAFGVPHPRRWTILWRRRISSLPPPPLDARCNLYLITAGNILDLKSFPVKYRNIKGSAARREADGRSEEMIYLS